MFTHIQSCLTMLTLVYLCLPLFTCVCICLLVFSYVYNVCPCMFTYVYHINSCLPMFSLDYPYLLVFTPRYLCLPLFTRVYLCLLMFTYVYSFLVSTCFSVGGERYVLWLSFCLSVIMGIHFEVFKLEHCMLCSHWSFIIDVKSCFYLTFASR